MDEEEDGGAIVVATVPTAATAAVNAADAAAAAAAAVLVRDKVWEGLRTKLLPSLQALVITEKKDKKGFKHKVLRPQVIMVLLYNVMKFHVIQHEGCQ